MSLISSCLRQGCQFGLVALNVGIVPGGNDSALSVFSLGLPFESLQLHSLGPDGQAAVASCGEVVDAVHDVYPEDSAGMVEVGELVRMGVLACLRNDFGILEDQAGRDMDQKVGVFLLGFPTIDMVDLDDHPVAIRQDGQDLAVMQTVEKLLLVHGLSSYFESLLSYLSESVLRGARVTHRIVRGYGQRLVNVPNQVIYQVRDEHIVRRTCRPFMATRAQDPQFVGRLANVSDSPPPQAQRIA